jgi:hypothetical protein
LRTQRKKKTNIAAIIAMKLKAMIQSIRDKSLVARGHRKGDAPNAERPNREQEKAIVEPRCG